MGSGFPYSKKLQQSSVELCHLNPEFVYPGLFDDVPCCVFILKKQKMMQDSYQLTTVKAIWDFLEVFYVDKNAASWLPERLVDWLAVSYKPGRTPLSSLYMLKDTSCFEFHVRCAQW